VLKVGRGPRRYLVAGSYISLPDLVATLGELSGRHIGFMTFPRWFLAGFGRAADLVQRAIRDAASLAG
jgi:hypothetical protein